MQYYQAEVRGRCLPLADLVCRLSESTLCLRHLAWSLDHSRSMEAKTVQTPERIAILRSAD